MTLIELVVAPVLHVSVPLQPFAVNVAESPAHILIAESAKVLSGQCEVQIWLIESANIPISVHAVTQLLVIEY